MARIGSLVSMGSLHMEGSARSRLSWPFDSLTGISHVVTNQSKCATEVVVAWHVCPIIPDSINPDVFFEV